MKGLCHKFNDSFIQIDFHDAMFLMPSPIPPIETTGIPHFSVGSMSQGGAHKNNQNCVLADGQAMLSRTHEVKRRILPHLNIPPVPVNAYIPTIIGFSSNKLEFAAASVTGPDGPIAVAMLRVCCPSMACNDPNVNLTSMVFTSGTVYVGFTVGDIVAGIVMCAIDMAVDRALGAIANEIGGPIGEAIAESIATKFVASIATRLIMGYLGLQFGGGFGLVVSQIVSSGISGLVEPFVAPIAEQWSQQIGLSQQGSRLGSELAKEGLSAAWNSVSGQALSEVTGGEVESVDGLFSPISRGVDGQIDRLFSGSEGLSGV
jgi:hypothetical protein